MNCIDTEIFHISRASLESVKVVTPFQDATMGLFESFGLSVLTLEDKDGNIGESPVYNTLYKYSGDLPAANFIA